ncbi:Gcp-like domain-containing protein [Gloeopeniophorella convolvens]|nr:Gcp-like domain-containing protein [Gloeopeniophorella convolvens]
MQAHALTPLLTSLHEPNPPTFPFLALLISGGHTLLLLARSKTSFRILATTPDEAIGRAFDKVSRLLALPWSPRGPGAALEECAVTATQADTDASLVPPMPRTLPGVLGFSFAGLHSTVERAVAARGGDGAALDARTRAALARAFQDAAVGQLEEKVRLALRLCAREGVGVRHVVVSGGVASNTYLRTRLGATVADEGAGLVSLVFPPPALCTDNAVMIAWAAMDRLLVGDTDDYSILIRPKWSIEELSGPSGPDVVLGRGNP